MSLKARLIIKVPHKGMSDKIDADAIRELDACGLFCPEPVMLLHNKIRDIEPGSLLRIIATDPSTSRDIPKFCVYLGHELVENFEQDKKYIYLVRKKIE